MNKENEERLKKAIFDQMSPRRQKHILRKGYDKWNPFEMPKDPVDIRMDQTRRTSRMLISEFLQTRDTGEYGNEFRRGAFELCMGIINEDERFIGMFEFACWYRDLLERENTAETEEE